MRGEARFLGYQRNLSFHSECCFGTGPISVGSQAAMTLLDL
jgi:hypothetical protein